MTKADIRARVRNLLKDEDSGAYRWASDDLDDYCDDALERTYDLRPDLFLTSSGIGERPGALATLGDAFLGALADYVAHLALSEDSADAGNVAQADKYLERYMQAMVGNQG